MSVINSFYQGNTSAKPTRNLHPHHNEMKGRTFIHQPGFCPSHLDQFVVILYVYRNGMSRVQGEKGDTFPVYTKNLREVPHCGVAL